MIKGVIDTINPYLEYRGYLIAMRTRFGQIVQILNIFNFKSLLCPFKCHIITLKGLKVNNIPKIHQEMFNLRKHRNLSKITLQRSLANFLNAIHYLYHQKFTISNIDLTKAYLLKTKTSKISSTVEPELSYSACIIHNSGRHDV